MKRGGEFFAYPIGIITQHEHNLLMKKFRSEQTQSDASESAISAESPAPVVREEDPIRELSEDAVEIEITQQPLTDQSTNS